MDREKHQDRLAEGAVSRESFSKALGTKYIRSTRVKSRIDVALKLEAGEHPLKTLA
jgi:hypothetical protein